MHGQALEREKNEGRERTNPVPRLNSKGPRPMEESNCYERHQIVVSPSESLNEIEGREERGAAHLSSVGQGSSVMHGETVAALRLDRAVGGQVLDSL